MKKANYIISFYVLDEYENEVENELRDLILQLDEDDGEFNFNERSYKTTNKYNAIIFQTSLYKLLEADKIFEVTSHCF